MYFLHMSCKFAGQMISVLLAKAISYSLAMAQAVMVFPNPTTSPIKDVHVGQAIDQRRNELGLSKSELGRRLGIPQQHINRLLERETMETKRLVKACKALDFNFFALFCPVNPQISAYLAAVALDGGDANNNIGDSGLAAQLTAEQAKVENLNGTIKLLKEQIDSLNAQIIRLDSNLKDKDAIIELLKERRQ